MPAAGRGRAFQVRMRRLLATSAAALGLLALPAAAGATVSCSKTSRSLQVTANQQGDAMAIKRGLGSLDAPLQVNGVQCGDATISNVDFVTFTAQAADQTVTIDYSGGFLTGGVKPNTDFTIAGFGDTTVATRGSLTSGTYVIAGSAGIDADIGFGEPDIFLSGVALFDAIGSNLQETMTTAGGAGVGGPYTGAALLAGNGGDDALTAGASATTLQGGDGDDKLTAGAGADASGGPDDDAITGGSGDNALAGDAGRDDIRGGAGNDTLQGGDGTDTLRGGAGNDGLDGGHGADAAAWDDVAGPIAASLAAGTATGAGADTLAGVETLVGSAAGDTLTGGPGGEALRGAGGNDTLADRGGADSFDGGPGTDTLSYAAAAGPVTADLAAGSATGAAGGDSLAGLERVTGGPFADRLLGTPAADVLAGGAGDDTIDPRGGPDSVSGGPGADGLALADGAADTGDCGAGDDNASIDATGDSLTACETVLIAPLACTPAFDIPGNGRDENCDGADARLRPVAATLAATWRRGDRGPTLLRLRATGMPAGGRATLRCRGKGCPFSRRTVRGDGSLNLRKALGRHRRFRGGSVLIVRLRAPFALEKRFKFELERGRIPRAVVRCAAPAAAACAPASAPLSASPGTARPRGSCAARSAASRGGRCRSRSRPSAACRARAPGRTPRRAGAPPRRPRRRSAAAARSGRAGRRGR